MIIKLFDNFLQEFNFKYRNRNKTSKKHTLKIEIVTSYDELCNNKMSKIEEFS